MHVFKNLFVNVEFKVKIIQYTNAKLTLNHLKQKHKWFMQPNKTIVRSLKLLLIKCMLEQYQSVHNNV